MEKIIIEIKRKMKGVLSNKQIKKLDKVLKSNLLKLEILDKSKVLKEDESDYCNIFIRAKLVEGCSKKSIAYYNSTIENMLKMLNKSAKDITTDDLRNYLSEYYKMNNCSKVTIDNIRRILSSFFSWLEDENYITKSPVRRIHKIRTEKLIKETLTDENLVVMRDNCHEIRDVAIIDMLTSTGIRVGELVSLNINDVNFNERECIVLGKGDKQRKVYFDAKTKIHLKKYLNSRTDDNKALVVSLLKPYNRLKINGVEIRLRQLGKKLNINKVHPHKFRRTLATLALDKGMPIEQVQKL